MPPDSYYENASSWEKEIRSGSRTTATYVKGLAALLVLFFLVSAAALNFVIASDASKSTLPLGVELSRNALNLIGAIAAAFGILFSAGALSPVGRWYEPDRHRYRAAALQIIESLRAAAAVDEQKEAALKDIAQRLLGAVEGKRP